MDYKKKLKTSLETIFGCNNYLNEVQKEAVENVLLRNRDIFISGYGKSLGYQLPVMVKLNTFMIVITSRTAYIKKYTDYFTKKQVLTHYLTASTTRRKRNLIENDMISKKSKMKLLFITPLQYETAYFKTILKKIDKQRLLGIVIDQADNIFSKQENLCNQYQNLDLKIIRVPIITITCTTSAKIQKDIMDNFHLLNPKVYVLPILRANLYCDVKFINIVKKPMEHLANFIENHLDMKSDTHAKEQKNLGLVICKDLEVRKDLETTNIAKSWKSEKIVELPKKILELSKKTNLENFKDVKLIFVCEKDKTLSVTNNLVQVMAPKPVKFIIYWQVLPNIEKHYSLISRVQCVYEKSLCRVYCKVDGLISDLMKSSCQNDINNELSTVILSSLTNMQCRHKAYSNFFGDKFAACKNRCDICKKPEKAKDKIKELMQIIDNLNLRDKLQEILKLPKDSIQDENLNDACSQPKISNYETESNVNVRLQKENREDDHPSADKNIANNNEGICENGVTIEKKKKALIELNAIYSKAWKKMPCQALSSSNGREIGRIGISKEPFLSKSLDNEPKSSNNSPATQSCNVRITSECVEASEICQRVIPTAYKYRQKKSLKRKKKTIEVINISDDDASYHNLDDKQHKSSSKKFHHSKKKTEKNKKRIELITISDDDDADHNKVNISNKKRLRSTVQTQGNSEQTKRRKLS